MCPLARPPIAGLQDICPMVSKFWVKIPVCAPNRAAARPASTPACPAPKTRTSNVSGYSYMLVMFHVESSSGAADLVSADQQRLRIIPP